MPKLRAPSRIRDPIKLADWLELFALLSDDRNSSRGDLESLLRRESIVDDEQERIIIATFEELGLRRKWAGRAYPFVIEGTVVRLRGRGWRRYAAYVFCLLLSYKGVRRRRNLHPERLFEEMATIAAGRFVGGPAHQFGFPRPRLPRDFAAAFNAICAKTNEGEGLFQGQVRDTKDDALDIIAWRPFFDKRPGQILLMGQCAAGGNWEAKRTELNPASFWNKWAVRQPVHTPTKAFFTPHRIEVVKWKHFGWDAGIVFDRCRIAHLTHNRGASQPLVRWAGATLNEINS